DRLLDRHADLSCRGGPAAPPLLVRPATGRGAAGGVDRRAPGGDTGRAPDGAAGRFRALPVGPRPEPPGAEPAAGPAPVAAAAHLDRRGQRLGERGQEARGAGRPCTTGPRRPFY